MTFDAWLIQVGFPRGETVTSIAERFGVHVATVYRWRRHQTLPSRTKVREIQKFTGGKVTPADWYCPPPPVAAEPQGVAA